MSSEYPTCELCKHYLGEVERLKAEIKRIKMLIIFRRDVVLDKINKREVGSLACEYNTLNALLEAINTSDTEKC